MEMEIVKKFDEMQAMINVQRKLIDELYDEKIRMINQIIKMDKRIRNLEQQHP